MVGTWTYDTTNNIITVVGGTEATPASFVDAWNADKAGTKTLKASATYDIGGFFSADTQPTPTDERDIPLYFVVTAVTGEWTITVDGLDHYGATVFSSTDLNSVGTFQTTVGVNFASVIANGFTLVSVIPGSITFSVVQGQWGVVWKTGTKQFTFDAKIQVSDGTTATGSWLGDTNKQIIFSKSAVSGNGQKLINRKRYGHIVLGQLDDATNKLTSLGVTIIFENDDARVATRMITSEDYASDSDVRIYSGYLVTIGTYESLLAYFQGTDKIYNTYLEKVDLTRAINCDVYRLTCTKNDYGIAYSSGTFNDLLLYKNTRGLYFYSNYASSLKNVLIKQSILTDFLCNAITTDKYVINTIADDWDFTWSGTSTATVIRQYEFDLTVTDILGAVISGATVIMKDKDGNIVFTDTTNVNGKITTQTVSRGYYNQTNGNILREYSPHTLTIAKSNYETYSWTGNIAEKIDWRISLLPTTPTRTLIGSRTKIKHVKSELEEPSLLLNTVLITKELKWRHKT